ncbi:MAG: adenylate kinase family protein [Candidatus Aenigmarchaeota archaeon]|nr:adenylate kinase family protein [Candidatus Aenigmarchaeota archaeon]
MIISITGTPGVGKTTVAKALGKVLGYKVISDFELAKKNKLILGFDKKMKSYIVDDKLFRKIRLKGDFIIHGHLSHLITNDLTIVLRLSPGELEKRLKRRGWKKEKIRENVLAEILDVVYLDAILAKKNKIAKRVVQIDTTGKSIKSVVKRILNIIKGREYKSDYVDWLEKCFEKEEIFI